MAYLYCNPDGVSREFSTVNDALASASDGDTIMLDAGVYTEQVYLDRHVNIRGLTGNPADVSIRPPDNVYPAVQINYDATVASGAGPTFIFECIDIACWHSADNWNVFTCINQTIGSDPINRPSLIFNRTWIRQVNPYVNVDPRLIYLSSSYFNLCRFDHCYLYINPNAGVQFHNAYWDRMVTGEILACEFDRPYSCFGCIDSPFPNNYVTTTTSGYGPAYSNTYYIEELEPMGYFDGYVMEESSPVQRTLNLHRRDTGEKVNTTTSNPAGYYYMDTTLSGMHYIVCLDAPADPLYNDLIIGSAYPTEL